MPVVTDGAFVFATPVAIGGTYSVTVLTQPTNPVQNCSGVLAFTVDPATGALTFVPGNLFATGLNALNLTVDPRGAWAYVACPGGVWVYSINPTTGALTPLSGNPSAAGMISPVSIAVAN